MARIENFAGNATTVNENTRTQTANQNQQTASLRHSNIAGAVSKLGENSMRSALLKNELNDAVSNTITSAPTDAFDSQATVTRSNRRVIIDTGVGNDNIAVSQTSTGDITVSVNGASRTFTGDDRDNLVIRASQGNDVIEVSRDVTVKLVLEGGDGDDTITGGSGNDQVNGGNGRDFINGAAGNDSLRGGLGNDVIYGGNGNDTLYGNSGDDYLEGSSGNDQIFGSSGRDVISGGLGDDTLDGGTNSDVVYAGQGKDNIKGGTGFNRIFAQEDDVVQRSGSSSGIYNTVIKVDLSEVVGSSLIVEGSDEFREIVEADIEMFRSSRIGRGMLSALDSTGQTITIRQTSGGDSATFVDRDVPGRPQPWYDEVNGGRGSSVSGFVNYNPQDITLGSTEFQPSVKLFHELAHNYDYTHGTLRPNIYNGEDTEDSGSVNVRERVATGLPIDHDNDSSTPEIIDPLHPKEFTENGLREETRLPRRNHYSL